MLNIALHMNAGAPQKIVFVHGFTQSGLVWKSLATRFADLGYEVMAPDLPGHGETDSKYDTADLWESGLLLGKTCGNGIYVGYSLGGRTLLHTALHSDLAPNPVQKMVVVGAKAGYKDREQAAKRTEEDNELADYIESLAQEDLSEFIDEWLQHPVNIRLNAQQAHRDIRLRNRPQGLAASLRHCGPGPQQSLWPKLSGLQMPVLVAYAEYDTPTILEDNYGLAEAIGENAQQIRLKGVGHSIPFEAPDVFADVVEKFIHST